MKQLHMVFRTLPWRRILVLSCAALVCVALWAETAQTQLAEKVIRLHVLANSDSQADQDLKLQVRDKVLAQAGTLLTGQEGVQAAAAVLQDNLDTLAQAAAQEIQNQGYGYAVQVSLEDTWFPTRQYEGIALPAGNYQALRVVIGEGEGHNWWCVVYPSLCLGAVSETALKTSGFTGQDYALVTEANESYVFKFKTIELLEELKQKLFAS